MNDPMATLMIQRRCCGTRDTEVPFQSDDDLIAMSIQKSTFDARRSGFEPGLIDAFSNSPDDKEGGDDKEGEAEQPASPKSE
jgi:hypothetical protein